mgnify:FL=1
MFALAPQTLELGSPAALAVAANKAVAMNVSARFLDPKIWNTDTDTATDTSLAAQQPKMGNNWPRIFLTGTQKGATTSFARLFERAGVCPSMQGKECHVLVKDVGKLTPPEKSESAVQMYTSQFADANAGVSCEAQGHYDGNPFLLSDRGAPLFLRTFMPHDLQPNVRVIAILREPAQRMLSWHNQRSPSPDPNIFAAKTATEIDFWVNNEKKWNARTGVQHFWDADNGHDYKTNEALWVHSPPLDMMVGMYENQVRTWTKNWPRKQLFIINYDHFAADDASVLKPLGKFMGIELVEDVVMPRVNVHSESTSICSAMCCETYCALQLTAFTDSNRRLYNIMDADRAAGRTPEGELPFGRFNAPTCVACDDSTTAEKILATCPSPDDDDVA